MGNPMKPSTALRTIKLAHTLIWAALAGCILAIPVFSCAGSFLVSSILIAVVTLEVMVIVFNRWSCPLTSIAARYTDDRQDNFDIYLPLWLAKYNQVIFGALFVAGVIYTLFEWLGSQSSNHAGYLIPFNKFF
jgi:polyferredoxin